MDISGILAHDEDVTLLVKIIIRYQSKPGGKSKQWQSANKNSRMHQTQMRGFKTKC